MRRLPLAFAFVVGLAAVVAAVAAVDRAAGDDPAPVGPVTSVDQLRGVSFVSRCFCGSGG
jgi:hypothetical protein